MTAAIFNNPRRQVLLWLAVVLGFACFSPIAKAQIPGLPKLPAAPAAPAPETSDQAEERLQRWLKEARAELQRLNEPDAEKSLPQDITPAALADYRRDIEQTITGITRHRKVVDSLPDVRKTLAEAEAANTTWHSFTEKPPYSILLLDDLMSQQDAIREKAASYQSSLALFSRTLGGIQDEGRDSSDADRRALSAALDDPNIVGAAKWRLEATRAKSRLLSVRATFLKSTIDLLKDQLATTKLQLDLLGRQIAIAEKNVRFTDEDLATVKKAAADRQTALRKELEGIRKREKEAVAVMNRMQALKDQLLKTTPEGTPLEDTPDLALALVRMEASETRVDSLQYVAGTLESLDELESDGVESYENRKAVLDATTREARASALAGLRAAHDRITARSVVFANELAAVNADIGRQEARASSRPADDPRLLPLNDVRASLWDKQAIVQRGLQAATAQNRLLQRWLDGFEKANSNRPVTQRLSDFFATTWGKFTNVWTANVFTYNDTVIISGVASTQERGVTLGQFFMAIFAFLTAYFVANRIKNRVRTSVVRRGHLADAQAKTLSNWLMIVVGVALAATTLHFLRIPITVFAFFGGALAIGLGFGTQTLIKNFISGIIVLFERKIRVGDVVDIGGTSGSVIEINTRSSVLRSADGREALVPNSVFLENTVTNLTLSNRSLRRFINVGVAYGSPPQTITTILGECADRHGLIQKDPAPLVIFQDFADSALIFKLYFWIALDGKTNPELVESDLRMMIEKRFAEAGIEFPFPQRDLSLRTLAPLQIQLAPPADTGETSPG